MLQKILFQTRENLSDNNPLKNKLAYYRYRYGPFSEVVDDNITLLVNDNKIKLTNEKFYKFDIHKKDQAANTVNSTHR